MEQAVHEFGDAEHVMSPTHWKPELDAHIFGILECVTVSHSSSPSTMEQAVHESGVEEHE
ncbi:MAG: hypothetical protein F4065_02185 [Rhodothermaceae bacterium]|nr:hypothetical protein [Bacteroidota bacterium]MXX96722.1 hypothetical protein [Rhodothermaceae bacterium]MCY3594789.1 hypothetical protein [Bacteroidota bacterium]MXZ57419.1 hypothetical protein [Rhodothermaceae bacterium]MYB90403.1 hypothetical protein [Rhodothermaceae bacterium]